MNIKLILLASISSTFLLGAFAQAPVSGSTPKIDARAANQAARVDQGQASGSLTNKEAANAEKHEAKLNNDIAAAKADSVVTKKERAKLTKEENRDSRKIARKKNNKRVAAPAN